MSWVVYILLCSQKTFYVGITNNLIHRVKSHKDKQNIGTKEFSDIKLVYYEKYLKHKDASKRENQLKGWTHAKKQALISNDLSLLKKLSKTHEIVEVNEG